MENTTTGKRIAKLREEKKLLDQYWLLNAEGRLALNLYIEFLVSQENYTKKVASSVS